MTTQGYLVLPTLNFFDINVSESKPSEGYRYMYVNVHGTI